MATTKLQPLQHDVPLVYSEGMPGGLQGQIPGTPTPYFIQLLQQLLEEKAITDEAAESALPNLMTENLILGRNDAGDGPIEQLTLSEVLDLIGSAAHGDILYRDSASWAKLAAGDDGKVLVTHGAGADPTWEAASGGSSAWTPQGAGYTTVGLWDQAVDGTVATVDFTGLTGDEVMIFARNVTKSVSGVLAARVSVDNGASFYSTSGDYRTVPASGTEANDSFVGSFHQGNATVAKSGNLLVPLKWINGTPLPSGSPTSDGSTGVARIFLASSSPINAIRILGHLGGNLTGGQLYCFTR